MKQPMLIVSMGFALLVASGFQNHADAEHVFWDVIAAGGTIESSSSGYRISASVGQIGVGLLEGSTHRVYSGFWNPGLFPAVGVQDQYGFGLPATYQLSQNYPNPFSSQTTVPFALPKPSHVSVEIYNLRGQMMRQIVHEAKESGYHVVNWDGRDDSGRRAGNGVYVCRMIARPSDGKAFVKSRRIVLVK